MRLRFYDTVPKWFRPCSTPKAQLTVAWATLQAAEKAYAPHSREVEIPGSAAETLRKQYEAARDSYDNLEFLSVDSAREVPLTSRLKALNKYHEAFYRRRV
jgi:hypothetical protein